MLRDWIVISDLKSVLLLLFHVLMLNMGRHVGLLRVRMEVTFVHDLGATGGSTRGMHVLNMEIISRRALREVIMLAHHREVSGRWDGLTLLRSEHGGIVALKVG